MRKLLFILPLAALLLAPFSAEAGETRIGNGCEISASSPSTGSSASDADCVWNTGDTLALQCDVAVYYSSDDSTPTTGHPKVAVGDPYKIYVPAFTGPQKKSKIPIKILPVSGTALCRVFRSDTP